MNSKKISKKIFDLFLFSDEETSDWINYKKLRITNYIFLSLLLLWFIFNIAIKLTGLEEILLLKSINIFIFRFVDLSFELAILISLIAMSYYYFKFIFVKKAKIYFINILFFYLVMVILFGIIYLSIYVLDNNNFLYINPHVKNTSQILKGGIDYNLMKLDFILYSAFQSIGGNFFKIQINSMVTSILGLIQNLFVFLLAALFVTSYINQKTKSLKD